jgi:hypothetical protein
MSWSRRVKYSPTTRLVALLSLCVWFVASGFCSIEALIRHQHDDTASSDHLHNGKNPAHSHDSKEKKGHENVCCTSLTTVLPNNDSSLLQLFQPLSIVWSLSLARLDPLPGRFSFHCFIFRQTQHCNLIFTPEVCLGPALRSLAPPSFC